ncbi:MAG: hypothetical protein ACRETW_10480, partial [Stenotrophobium sp.]
TLYWRGFACGQGDHPMGEAKRKRELAAREVAQACGLDLPAGKVRVLWDQRAAVTPLGQMPYFIEFLHLSGLWSRWVADCPLHYTSPNAPGNAEVLCKISSVEDHLISSCEDPSIS